VRPNIGLINPNVDLKIKCIGDVKISFLYILLYFSFTMDLPPPKRKIVHKITYTNKCGLMLPRKEK